MECQNVGCTRNAAVGGMLCQQCRDEIDARTKAKRKSSACLICGKPVRGRGYVGKFTAHKKCMK